ncbi:Carbohydrate-selective porin OprB (OprB) (PDB:4GEY) [Commensalibacter communis]|uniref:carbohydrate porin n=1 Tax=Commensalibacter communis TaxID=2972786 RepID=UPI0022FF9CFC|nr:carbohydrate porin [Commensalibacter communis]CAI3950254.1 Carbohydrate-selective porin OprB (OprB) (PDB:4GEY) [Commensalibacter communis]CAI3950480.1 Carbohydrate-selective porin OprB (OprB) (PDB:4GEY) [Commensalibacter communis]
MALFWNKPSLLRKKEFSFLSCLLVMGGMVLFDSAAKADGQKNKPSTEEFTDDNSPLNGLTDWHLVPAGGGGDWKTAIGRVQSNAKDIERLKTEGNPLLPQPEHLFGTWGGINPWLYKRGINLNLDNQNEFAGNITGGKKKGATNAGAVDANLDVDWSTLVGKNWLTDGLVSHMTVLGRYGSPVSKLVGENITSVQEIYGAGGNVVAKLVNLYNDKYFMDGKIVTSFGRTNVGGFYATSPIHCYFMNNGLCGNPKPLTGQAAGFNAWPDSTWGITTLFRPIEHFYVRIGIFQVSRAAYGNASGHRAGWASLVRTGSDAGGEFPLEVGYEPHWGKNDLVGHYKAGFAYDTSSYPVWGSGLNGKKITAMNGSDQRWKRGRDVEWLLLDQMFHRNGPGDLNGVIGYVGFVHSNPLTFQRQNQVIVGMINTGFWKARPMDAFGLLFIHQIMSGKMRDAQRYNLAHGFPIQNIGDATGIQTSETSFEATYIIHVYRGVRFQPDFQYEIHPNAQKNIKDAAFLGFKSRIDF